LGPEAAVAVAWPVTLGSVEVLHCTVAVGGQTRTGGGVSDTVSVCTQLEELPQLSSAVQVRVITAVPAQLPGAVLSV
jgi:hypothetical protein